LLGGGPPEPKPGIGDRKVCKPDTCSVKEFTAFKVTGHIQKILLLRPTLNQIKLIPLQSTYLKIHFNLILPNMCTTHFEPDNLTGHSNTKR